MNILRGVICGQLSVVFISDKLPIAERVVEVLQNFIGLEVLLLVVNDCLEPRSFTDGPELLYQSCEALVEKAKCPFQVYCVVAKPVVVLHMISLFSLKILKACNFVSALCVRVNKGLVFGDLAIKSR